MIVRCQEPSSSSHGGIATMACVGEERWQMLKIGYALMLAAGAGLVGFALYHAVSLLISAPDIGLFFKVLILVAGVGIGLTLIGLVIEKRKDGEHVASDDE